MTEGTPGMKVRSGCPEGVPFTGDLNSSREHGEQGWANGCGMTVRARHSTLQGNSHKQGKQQGLLSDRLGVANRGSKQLVRKSIF